MNKLHLWDSELLRIFVLILQATLQTAKREPLIQIMLCTNCFEIKSI